MAALINLLVFLLYLYSIVIIVRAVVSWAHPDPNNPLVRILLQLTEPVLKPLRVLVPPEKLGGIDVTPILALVAIQLIRYALLGMLY